MRPPYGRSAARDEVSTTSGRRLGLEQSASDLEAVVTGQADVEQHDVGSQRRRLRRGRSARRPASPTTVKALALEQRPGLTPEAGVVVDERTIVRMASTRAAPSASAAMGIPTRRRSAAASTAGMRPGSSCPPARARSSEVDRPAPRPGRAGREPGAAGGRSPAHAVVAERDESGRPTGARRRPSRVARAGVLGGVRERFGRDEICRRLDRWRQPSIGDREDAGRDGRPFGQRREPRRETGSPSARRGGCPGPGRGARRGPP